ncbi:MAG: O(6)-alkylguanine repair protein YbaZ [Cyanobacteria bacterium RYN_339]|nr:O(6)-alkylguanine repair protein YbaZ [Cyanobacteria bacterium RYN_339]
MPEGNFYERVYHWVRQIPPGQVTTYGAIAALAGNPMAPRAVGYALRVLPENSDVPWQRVVNKAGKVSPRGVDPGLAVFRQRKLLEREGVAFDADDCIDFKRFAWAGPAG